VPYFVRIAPERITDYRIDKYGVFEWVEFEDTVADPSDPDKTISVVRRYDKDGWQIRNGEDTLDSGSFDIGVCPVLAFGENGDFPTTGEFTQIAAISKRHFNLKSELHEMMRSQVFSILTMQGDPKELAKGLDVSTHNALSYPKDHDRPAYIAPPSAPADTYQKEIASLEREIDRIAYDTSTSEGTESGIALQIKFQGLNGSLSNFAMRLEDLEARMFDVACRYLGLTNDVEISYPREFHIIDTEKELATLQALKDLGYTIPKYEATKLAQIVQNDLGGIAHAKIDEIVGEIEDALKEDTSSQ
jgi:hypothetical protein